MLPTLTFEIPEGKEWKYEVKYDGFRALLTWNGQLELNSRNGKPLLSLFPEISEFLKKERKKIKPFLPMVFDGEIVFLENDYKSNFNHVQTRGRMRSQPKIAERAEQFPCRLLLFDVIVLKGKDVRSMPYSNRKQLMESFFSGGRFTNTPGSKKQQARSNGTLLR